MDIVDNSPHRIDTRSPSDLGTRNCHLLAMSVRQARSGAASRGRPRTASGTECRVRSHPL